MQERFHSGSPDDFDIMFIKVGDSETKEGLKEATGKIGNRREPRQGRFGSRRNRSHSKRREPRQGCCSFTENSTKNRASETGSEGKSRMNSLPTAHCSPGCKSNRV